MGSKIEIPFLSNCIRSLSDETIVTSISCSIAFFAYEAIKSSASKPGNSIEGTLKTSGIFFIISNCGIKSSGGSDLFAL